MPSGTLSQSLQRKNELEPQASQNDGREERQQAIHDGQMDAIHAHPPKTPGRISLSDLTANPEDSFHQLPAATPLEHVTWKHVPGLMQTPSSVNTTQRGTKRSHSSSPASSQARKSRHFDEDDSIDMKSVSQSLQRSPARSPNPDDPAAILWRRYAGDSVDEPTLPPLPALEVSPRTPGDGKKESAFRRALSCNTNWPTSATKRRKLQHPDPHSTTKQIFASKRRQILKRDEPHQSRVSLLLDSVQQSLVARRREQEEPSSSSPLPERFCDPDTVIYSPAGRRRLSPSPKKRTSAGLSPTKPSNSPLKVDKSSDFGDLDFDDDELEVIEQVMTQQATQSGTRRSPMKSNSMPLVKSASGSRLPDSRPPVSRSHNLPSEKEQLRPPLKSQNDFDNDFDDFDDDDDELQELAEKVDSQPMGLNTSNVATNKTIPPKRGMLKSFDGVFDGDGDDDDDILQELDMNVLNNGGTTVGSNAQKHIDNRTIKRYLVNEVLESTYEISPGKTRPEKVLSLKDEKTKRLFVVLLRQSWFESRCTPGSYIHLIGEFDRHGHCVVDDNDNMLILHPDHLISATVIGDAMTCLRRATLQDRVKATAPPEKPQVYGHILHEAFGQAMMLNDWTDDTFSKLLHLILPNYLESLYECSLTVEEAHRYLMTKVPLMRDWAAKFVSTSFQHDAVLSDRNGAVMPAAIHKLLELEEHVWSPMYGLKGNIDATVQAKLLFKDERQIKSVLAPLELKTGMRDDNHAHRAQTALYTLLLSDRYDVDVTNGILYYVETAKTVRIEGIRREVRQMIQWRNELACYVRDKLDLPPMAKREHLCKRCYAQTSCFTYHKLSEDGDGVTSGMGETFTEAVSHLKPTHQDFFKKWDVLLTKEERDAMKFKRELWTMLSTERESVGRCFSKVIIEPGSAMENVEASKINRYTYSFVKQNVQPGFSFAESQVTVGEPIVISDEHGHFALANGFVTHVRPTRITVAVDRKLVGTRRRAKDFDAVRNQSFNGIMEVGSAASVYESTSSSYPPVVYRIDKDEFSNGMATVRNNLIRLMEHDLFKAADLRRLIVENKAPAFKMSSTAYQIPSQNAELNPDQRQAISKVMSARDYALVLGMPGTGKTTTIAHIIRALVGQGKSVLLTSYTHTAVDNILLKIKDDKIPVLRLGSVGKVHPEVKAFADLSGIPKKTVEELEHCWSTSKVVATTCLSINHGIFNHRIFDYCIVDEASQITLPVCLGPIRFANTFILVGDHYQLPPLVQNKEAAEGGLDISLFKHLSDAQPESVVSLEHQYRMAEDIMHLANILIYNGRLKCGTKSVAERSLQIPDLEAGLAAHHHSHAASLKQTPAPCSNLATCWLGATLQSSSPRALFLNTDMSSTANEHLSGQRITNTTECTLLTHLLSTLVSSGVPPSIIGVITFYRSQLSLLRTEVRSHLGNTTASLIEMHTADKYQGRDKEVILISCVRSNASNSVGELLRDWRRVNVAITRARSKLIIVGSRSTLAGSGVPVLEGLVKTMHAKGWLMDLPANALEGHKFDAEGVTQSSIAQSHAAPAKSPARARQPLAATNRNPAITTPRGLKRQPAQVVRGQVPLVDLENILGRNPVMKNVLEDVLEGAGGGSGAGRTATDGIWIDDDDDEYDDFGMDIDGI